MDRLLEALAPVLVTSVALQQLLELLDPILEAAIRRHKKWVLSLIALGVGLGLSFGLGLRMLTVLGFEGPAWLDSLVTALFLIGGTRSFDDLLKWLGYKKEAARQGLRPEQVERV